MKPFARTFAEVRPPLLPSSEWKYLDGEIQLVTDGYAARTAWVMAELSLLAYCKQEVISGVLSASNFEAFEFFEDGPHAGFGCVLRRTPILIFRGTRAAKLRSEDSAIEQGIKLKDWVTDWITNVSAVPIASDELPGYDGGGKVHAGFARASKALAPQINAWLASVKASTRQPLLIAGHSLGGAMAAMSSALLRSYAKRSTYTFGAPCVGNEAFVKTIGERPIYRHVFVDDIVPNLPLAALSYRHAQTELVSLPATEQPLRYDGQLSIANTWRALPVMRNLAAAVDHAPVNYAAACFNAIT
jgi:hypothetical protein